VTLGTYFAHERTRKPTEERRVLQAILAETQGTGWDTRIETRLAGLP
jgi:hypothetical protein